MQAFASLNLLCQVHVYDNKTKFALMNSSYHVHCPSTIICSSARAELVNILNFINSQTMKYFLAVKFSKILFVA